MRTVYYNVERWAGTTVETKGISGTEDEIEEQLLRDANTLGVVHVLDARGHIERTITPADAADLLRGE